MIYSTSIFPELDETMRKLQVTRKMLSDESGINYYTLGDKLRGKSEFTCAEMFRIRNVLKKRTADKLFWDNLFTTGSDIGSVS